MELVLREEQKILKQAVHSFVEKECPKSLVREMEADDRGYSLAMWEKMAELGWLGILFPEEFGGFSDSPLFDATLMVEEFGWAALPSPFFSTVALGGLLVLEAGSPARKQEWLPGIAQGKRHLTVAVLEPPECRMGAAGIATTAVATPNGFKLNGAKLSVPNAHIAETLVVAARSREGGAAEDGISLFMVDARNPNIVKNPLKTSAGDKLFEVTFRDVTIGKDSLLGRLHAGWPPLANILDKAAVLKAAEIVGACQAALESTIAYSKMRVQFGRPIGSFQAVHHHFANMYRNIELTRRLVYQAAWRVSHGLPSDKDIAMAKGKASSIAPEVAELAHRIHGGVGYFAEYDLEIYTRRLLGAVAAFGDARYHNERIARYLEALEPAAGGHVY